MGKVLAIFPAPPNGVFVSRWACHVPEAARSFGGVFPTTKETKHTKGALRFLSCVSSFSWFMKADRSGSAQWQENGAAVGPNRWPQSLAPICNRRANLRSEQNRIKTQPQNLLSMPTF